MVTDGPDGKDGRIWPSLVAVTILGTLIRSILSYVMFLQADEEIFGYNAYYIFLGRPLEFVVRKIGAYMAYPYALSFWYRAFGVSLLSARFFTVMCWAIVIALIFLIIHRTTGSRKAASAGSLMMALSPFSLRYGVMVLSEPMAWVFISASILMLVIGLKRERWYLIVASGTLGSLAVFSRRSALILVLVMVPLLVWSYRGRLPRMFSRTFSYLIGFAAPIVLLGGGLVLHFGWERLMELHWLRVPHFTAEYALDLGSSSVFRNAVFTLQPTISKGATPFLFLGMALAIAVASLFRDRWRAVYVFSVIYPALVRIAFDGHLSGPYLLAVMLAPGVMAWTISGSHDRGRWTNASCLLLASSVAYSSFVLSGDIWNVVIYTSTAALVILYLEDRVKGELTTPAMVALALAMLLIIGLKEPQISKLLIAMASVWTISFGLTLPSRKVPGDHTFLGLMVPGIMIAFLDGSYLSIIAASLLIGSGVLLYLIRNRPGRWVSLRYPMASVAMAALLFLPGYVHLWMVVLAAAFSIVTAIVASVGPSRSSWSWPAALASVIGFMVYIETGDRTFALLAAAIVLAVSLTLYALSAFVSSWSRSVDHRVTMLLPLMTLGYLAFYVYYAWTEVYMTEFLVVSCLGFGILVHILTIGRSKPIRKVHAPIEGAAIVPRVRTVKVPGIPGWWKVSFVVLLAITVPISVQSFLEDDWFHEGPMDKRPYMDTIREVSDWIRDNTEEGEKVLAWHCYALQAGRETIIEVSNAQVYDGVSVISDMERYHVNVFVLCWYTNHGLWEGQPVFQEYIHHNFHVVRSIDGNLCYLRNGP